MTGTLRWRPSDEPHAVDVVTRHPRIQGLGATPGEQERVGRFARDLARWLHGAPREELGPLARVVITVLGRELRDARALCRDRPLLAVESAARSVEALWPLLRWDEPEPRPPEPEPPDDDDDDESRTGQPGAATTDAADADSSEGDQPTEEDPEEGAEAAPGEADDARPADDDPPSDDPASEDPPSEDPSDPSSIDDLLAELADLAAVHDPELEALARRLRERMGDGADAVEVGTEAADLMEGVGEVAAQAAIHTDRLARQLERFLPGVGWSSAPGRLEVALLDQLGALTSLLERLPELRELADRLGRLEEASRRRGPAEGGREEVVGVRLGEDFANALPSELALLADPDTEYLFYQRFLERRLVMLELEGAGDDGVASGDRRGPVVACIDTSASMAGAPEQAAKALVLALCRRVVPQGRLVHLILFGGPGERTEIRIRRGLGGLEGLIGFLGLSFHSGTDFDGPLLRAMDLLEEQELRAADVLVVTDGLCRANRKVVDRVDEVRRALGARVWSVVLGRRDVDGVAPFSDEVHRVDPTADGAGLELLDAFRRA